MVETGLRGAPEIAEYIIQNYRGRVVEVGVGRQPSVASRLVGLDLLDLLVTDRSKGRLGSLAVVGDDVFAPRMELYDGASLIYSIRPPLEMQLAMGTLAIKTGSDVLIRPLGEEIADLPGFKRRLVNLGQASFYLFQRT